MAKQATLSVDQGEIDMLMKALNKLAGLTPAESTTRAAVAYKLGCAAFDLLPEADERGASEYHREEFALDRGDGA